MAHSIRLELSQRSKTAWHLCRRRVSAGTLSQAEAGGTQAHHTMCLIYTARGSGCPPTGALLSWLAQQEVPLPPAFDAYTTATLFANPCTPSS